MHKIKHTFLFCLLLASLLLGCWEDHVALFHGNDSHPLEVYPLRVEMLPLEDQRDLQAGIPISGAAELNALLEDLLS